MSEPLSSFATQALGLGQQAVTTHNCQLPSGFAARPREAAAGGPHGWPGSSQGVSPLMGDRALNGYFVQGLPPRARHGQWLSQRDELQSAPRLPDFMEAEARIWE